MYTLNRLCVIDSIQSDTPLCVIIEAARCSAINIDEKYISDSKYLNNVINQISAVTSITLDNTTINKNSNLPYIARYVNPLERNWTNKNILMSAFMDIYRYHRQVDLPPSDFKYGPKTNTQPLNYDACMLYKICRHHHIVTNRHTTCHDMATMVSLLLSDTSVVLNQVMSIINNSSKESLTTILSHIHNAMPSLPIESKRSSDLKIVPVRHISVRSSEVDTKKESSRGLTDDEQLHFMTAYKKLSRGEELLYRISPLDINEAIALSALLHHVNVFSSAVPIQEYKKLVGFKIPEDRSVAPNSLFDLAIHGVASFLDLDPRIASGVSSIVRPRSGETFLERLSREVSHYQILLSYEPCDEKFRRQFVMGPYFFNIKMLWSNLFIGVYTRQDLMTLAQFEGHKIIELPTSAVADSSAIPSLNMLLHTDQILNRTFYHGGHYRHKNNQTPINLDTIAELKSTAMVTYGVLDDGELNIFTYDELSAYFKNTNTFTNPLDIKETFSTQAIDKLKNLATLFHYDDLLAAIKQVEVFRQAITSQGTELSNMYKKSDFGVKLNVETTLFCLLEAAYYMRGWKVSSSEYPITAMQTIFSPSRQSEVDVNVTQAIQRYEKSVNSLTPELMRIFYSLPLLRAIETDGKIAFQTVTSHERTINERLQVVKDGESCIRLSSNYFAASAYYYINITTGRTAFDLTTFNFNIS